MRAAVPFSSNIGLNRVAFKTIGCRLNQAETAQMAAEFEAAGYRVVPFGEPCEVAVVHTCAVTRHAEKVCVRTARLARRLGGEPLVVLAGCAVEVDARALQEASGADVVVRQADKFRLHAILRQ